LLPLHGQFFKSKNKLALKKNTGIVKPENKKGISLWIFGFSCRCSRLSDYVCSTEKEGENQITADSPAVY
jgi:hypothetical protein